MGRAAPLLTRTLLFVTEGSAAGLSIPPGGGGKWIRAFDKRSGRVVAEIALPAGATGAPMTYLHEGRQVHRGRGGRRGPCAGARGAGHAAAIIPAVAEGAVSSLAPPRRRPSIRASWTPWTVDLCAVTAYAALTVAMTWPLVVQVGDGRAEGSRRPAVLDLGDVVERAGAAVLRRRGGRGQSTSRPTDTLALADHRVGLGLISTPLIWAGASPLTAYGVAFLASFLLSAAAAYALCLALTASRPAAFVGGLVFGFHPYRAAHLEHVELLSAVLAAADAALPAPLAAHGQPARRWSP